MANYLCYIGSSVVLEGCFVGCLPKSPVQLEETGRVKRVMVTLPLLSREHQGISLACVQCVLEFCAGVPHMKALLIDCVIRMKFYDNGIPS